VLDSVAVYIGRELQFKRLALFKNRILVGRGYHGFVIAYSVGLHLGRMGGGLIHFLTWAVLQFRLLHQTPRA
jgi:hypothetical protein